MRTITPRVAFAEGLFETQLAAAGAMIEPELQKLLPENGRLAEAMRYAVLGNGKRFRPFLALESAKLFGVPKMSALNVAAAIELLHCYSLVHDDLPAMDDDDMRRGKPAVHKVFDEATAILAGDALQALSFETLAKPETSPDASIRSELIAGLAQAAGRAGMAGGQQLDIAADGNVENVSAMKTGALICFCTVSGAILGKAADEERRALATFGLQLGLAFQISDDILDVGKDAATGKRTFATSLGLSGARDELEHAVERAVRALDRFADNAASLRDAAEFMRRRAD